MFNAVKRELDLARKLMAFSILRLIAQVVGIGLPLLIAKFFSEQIFGSFSLTKMIVFLAVTFTTGITRTPFIVYASEEIEESGKINKTFSIQLIFLFCGIITATIAFLVFHTPIAKFAGITTTDLIFAFVAFLGIAGKFFFCNLLMAMGKQIRNGIAELTYACSSVIIIILFHIFDNLTLRTVFLSYFLSTVLLFLTQGWILDIRLLLPFQIDLSLLKKTIDFAKWIFLAAIATYLINWGDNIVLKIFVSLKEIGIYNFGYQVFKSLVFSIGIIPQYFLPFIAANISNSAKIRNYLYSKRPKILALGCLVWLIAFFGIPFAIKLVYGSKFSESIPIFQILSIAILFSLYLTFYAPVYNALKKYRFTTFVAIAQITFNLLFAFILVPYYGIKGAAIATVIAFGVKLIVFEFHYRRYLKKRFSK
ncbi:MAG: hypothetical protein DRP56_02885 [Planctomycetota bacterium]|nr:MAG: hypothetical protein DRP56_02885 [Planctomycetota bacterium]